MKRTYTITETLVVSKTVEVDIPEDVYDDGDWDEIEELIKDEAYQDTIIGNTWSIDDCLDVEIVEEKD